MINFMEKYVYQMFILGLQQVETIINKGVGGVIFFKDDIITDSDLRDKIKHIKSSSQLPPFVSIDQEGGRVERTENIRPKRISARDAYLKGKKYLQAQSDEISKELADWGFNLNFAPCVDVNTNEKNPIIGERSFSSKTEDVIEGAEIFINSSRKYGIVPCVKHYPGHGDADKDSHLTLPKIDLTIEKMEKIHIKPFKWAVDNNIEMIMAAHLHCTCFDNEVVPASLSRNAIGYLRNELKYDGVIISDDMVMKGVQEYGSLEACIMGINAGLDMFIFRNSDNKTLDMIDELVRVVEQDKELQRKVLASYDRIIKLKRRSL